MFLLSIDHTPCTQIRLESKISGKLSTKKEVIRVELEVRQKATFEQLATSRTIDPCRRRDKCVATNRKQRQLSSNHIFRLGIECQVHLLQRKDQIQSHCLQFGHNPRSSRIKLQVHIFILIGTQSAEAKSILLVQ